MQKVVYTISQTNGTITKVHEKVYRNGVLVKNEATQSKEYIETILYHLTQTQIKVKGD